jgi:murein DD-endopeptidase MepM/ murein hydrolase activator NlpD
MSQIASVYCSRVASRLALIGAAAGLLAGCAGSERMADPFGNLFQTSQAQTDPASTASINPPSAGSAAPVTPVQSRPLAAPAQNAAPPPPHAAAAAAGWSAAGGTPITVAQGESVAILSTRYGVPADALLKANGLASAAQVQPGARLIIPVYNAVATAPRVAQAVPPPRVHAAEAHAEKIRLLKGVVGAKAASVNTATAKAEKVAPEPRAAASKTIAEKGRAVDAVATKVAVEAPAKDPHPKKSAAAQTEAVTVQTAALAKQDAAKHEAAKPDAAKPAKAAAAETAKPEQEASAASETAKAGVANPEFRWPARGRIIQAFKPGGNDGINIAVPEGTSVKAAESGVVAYAGNELKGYGNLILIRHPNGFVTAYANNGDIEVKRGETVKRGQVIAKSGQSGNVASPQLHFELRKGATPVDPTQYLAGL